jgi:GNAT superfamily N-acetyltransferase
MAGEPRISIVEGPAARDYADPILRPLDDYNRRQTGDDDWHPFAIVLEDPETGAVTGGCFGVADYGWCFVKFLVVPEAYRGMGIGTRLMAEAETIARRRSRVGIWLDTFEFQARPFYEKLGYRVFGELEAGPAAYARYFLKKVF